MGMATEFLGNVGWLARSHKEFLQQQADLAMGVGVRAARGVGEGIAEGSEALSRGWESGGPAPAPQPLPEAPFPEPNPDLPITDANMEFERRLQEAAAAPAPPPGPVAPPQAQSLDEAIGEMISRPEPAAGPSKEEQEALSMQALKESLGFEYADKASIDPATGRPAQPKQVTLRDTGATQRDPGYTFTPPLESQGANVSDMAHPQQGQFGADTGTMSPNQKRAHGEELKAMAESRMLEALAKDPYAEIRAEAGAGAGAKMAVARDKIQAQAAAEEEAQADIINAMMKVQEYLTQGRTLIEDTVTDPEEMAKELADLQANARAQLRALEVGSNRGRAAYSGDVYP